MKKYSKDSKSNLVLAHLPCETCGSSDALSTYDDGHSFCFSCGDHKKGVDTDIFTCHSTLNRMSSEADLTDYTLQYIGQRGISVDTFKKYSVKCRVSPSGEPIAFQYPYGSQALKVKTLNKDITTEGDFRNHDGLFGQENFGPGSANAVTITEGEEDCLAAFQMLGSKYPCVSIKGATSARRDCERAFKWLNSFEKIYICFDNDIAGEKAARSLQGLFDGNKVYHVKLGLKDANEYLKNDKAGEFTKAWWNAKNYLPQGVINSFDDIENILKSEDNKAIATYPFPSLQDMTYGIRSKELVLFTALEKVGKTEIIRAIEHHLLKTTDYNIGIIHLEEQEKRSVQGLVSYELGVASHLPDAGVNPSDTLAAYKSLVKRDGRLHFYKHFGSDDPDNILDVIRYLVGVQHCKFIFLDHITMLVTGFENEDERTKLDYLSTKLAMMTRELDFTLFLVSHVNDNGQTRGSRNISKVADLLLHLDRDIEAESYDLRNQTKLICRGNRFASSSGPAGILWFNAKDFTVKELEAKDIGGIDAYNPDTF